MKRNLFPLLFSLISIYSCNNYEVKNSSNIENDSINKEILTKERKQDSLIEIRKKNNVNSILYLNTETNFVGPNLNIDILEMYNLLDTDISSIEDFLSTRNWKLYGKGTKEKKELKNNGKITVEYLMNSTATSGKFIEYRNLVADTEIYVFQNEKNREITITLNTVNDFNYNKLLSQISNYSFKSEEGNSIHDPHFDLSGNKKYTDELVIIESKIKFYNEKNFEIKTYYYVKSPVINTFKSEDEFSGYSYNYNNARRINYYKIVFSKKH